VPLCGVAPLVGLPKWAGEPDRLICPRGVPGGQGSPRQGLPAGTSDPEPSILNLIHAINKQKNVMSYEM